MRSGRIRKSQRGRQSLAAPVLLQDLMIPQLRLTFLIGVALALTAAADEKKPTPAEVKIALAEKQIAAKPELANSYAPLAFAYAARARETADGNFYTKAMAAAEKGLAIDPKNMPSLKAQTWVLLGQHEFQKALEKARALRTRTGDDPQVYALLADAAIETGDYQLAEESAQWALDMDTGGIPGLTRAAYLREHFGDFDGAIELMKQAFNRTRPSDSEDRAWLLTHIGHLLLLKNQPAAAIGTHEEALKLFPGYHYALLNLAHAKAAQGKYDEALELHRKHYAAAPHPENLYELALAMKAAGKDDEAKKAFADFEKGALGESENVDNANRELTAYYVDIASKPKEALRIAKIEMGNRTDYRTLHAYAWALHANGQYKEAQKEMAKALEVGVKEPVMQYHAGVIARDAGDPAAAEKFFKASLSQAPKSKVSAAAATALKESSK